MINQFLEGATERSTTTTSVKNAGGRSSTTLRSCYLKIGYQNWPTEDKSEEKIPILCESKLSTINSCTFEQWKDIQEKLLLILALQNNLLIPKGFTEYLCHVGNANELNSIVRNGLIPGGMSLKKEEDKQSSSQQ